MREMWEGEVRDVCVVREVRVSRESDAREMWKKCEGCEGCERDVCVVRDMCGG